MPPVTFCTASAVRLAGLRPYPDYISRSTTVQLLCLSLLSFNTARHWHD
jgi:hypothetical protein